MRQWYTVIYYLLLPFVMLYLCLKANRNPAYLKYCYERLAIHLRSFSPQSLWIHAASVGEVRAVIPLVKACKQQYPTLPILVTHHTPTGTAYMRAELDASIDQLYAPFDLPWVIKRFLNKVQPRALLLVETELWPNYLDQCCRRKIPTILINARLSARSAQAYGRFAAGLTRQMLHNLTQVAAQTEMDAQRFIKLGLAPQQIQITGNSKFDLELPIDLVDKAKQLRSQLGDSRAIWVAASTHPGEEEQLLKTYARVRQTIADILLVLVPRHPERFTSITRYCRQKHYNVVQRSTGQACSPDTAIYIGDTIGELMLLYAIADLAFIGGSLVKKGGHNPIEPAALGLVILTGPYTFNFSQIMVQLQQIGAAITIANHHQLAAQVIHLLQNTQQRRQLGIAAKQFVQQNRGATQRQLTLLKNSLSL